MRRGFAKRPSGLVIVATFLVLLGGYLPAGAGGRRLPVPTITIYPGEMIQASHLTERLFGVASGARLPFIRSQSALEGKVARRTLLAMKPIPVNAIRDPHVIRRGSTTKIVYRAGALTITSSATALQSGGVGDVISARNNDSSLIVRGVVQADRSIRVGAH